MTLQKPIIRQKTTTVETDASELITGCFGTTAITCTIVLQPSASSSSSTGTNKRRLEHDDDYGKLLKCEIERVQVEKRKLELECCVHELKQILLQHNVDDIQKLNGCPWIFYN